jgi:tripartite-type tricarboxylate transporter receptor subunit TctC
MADMNAHCNVLKAAFVALVSVFSSAIFAQDYPSRPVRMISPFPPGGSVDLVARLVAAKLTETIGQQVVVENRSGASGNIGTEAVARSAPDGYTLLLNTTPFVTNTFLYSRVPYDVVADFAPVSLVSSSPSVVTVHPSVPVFSVAELVALARSRRGTLNYGSAGVGTNPHISGELFNYLAKTNIVAVHFKGGGPALIATMSGEITVTFSNISETKPYVVAKRLRALGVSSLKPSSALPGVLPIANTLPGYEFITWHGVLAPRATPRGIVQLLHEKLRAGMNAPEQAHRFAERGLDVVASTPDEFAARLKEELARWGPVIRERGMKAE